MEDFERNLNSTDAPKGSVRSHRDALRDSLKTVKPHSAHPARKSVITLSLVLVLGLTGLTIANPDWAKDLYRIIKVEEVMLTTEDGKQIHIKTVEAEASTDPSKLPVNWQTDAKAADVIRELKEGDPGYDELLEAGGNLERVLQVNAEFDDNGMGESGEQEVIMMRTGDGDVWIVNGDTVTSVEQIQALEEHGGTLEGLAKDEALFFSDEDEAAAAVAHDFELHQSYPNPFNPTTTIAFDLKQAQDVRLRVFDITGREVVELINGPQSAGSHTVRFDGAGLSSGTYFYTLTAGNYSETKNMVLMK